MSNKIREDWEKLDRWWYRKAFISNSEPKFTYHYKSKLSRSCKVFEVTTKKTNQLCGFMLIEKDLRDSIELLNEYSKLFTASGGTLFSKNIVLKGLMKAIVITYGKCFSRADGRKIKLSRKDIPKEYEIVHEDLINMRNQYVAHSGKTNLERCKFVFLLPPEKKGKTVRVLTCHELYQTTGTSDFFGNAKFLMEKVIINLKNKISCLKNNIQEEIDSISRDKFYEFSRNKCERSSLNEADLARLIGG